MARFEMIMAAALLCTGGVGVYFALPDRVERIVLEPATCDFGRVEQDETHRAEFVVRNDLKEKIILVASQSSCDCTDLTLERNEIKPGEQCKANVIWKTGARRGTSETQSSLLFVTASGRRELIPMTIRGFVAPDIECDSERILFSTNGGEDSHTVQFRPGTLAKFELRRAYATHSAFDVILDKYAATVALRFDPSKWSPDARILYLKVDTSSRHEPTIQIPIEVR